VKVRYFYTSDVHYLTGILLLFFNCAGKNLPELAW